MKRLLAALVVAVVVTAAVVPDAAALVTTGHAPRCSYATGVGDFCVNWNTRLGRYDPPPPGVPADFSRDTPDGGEMAFLATYAGLVFLGTTVTTWLVLTLLATARRRRDAQPDVAATGTAEATVEAAR